MQSQTIVSPQVVAFDVDLASTASGQTVAASFTSVSGCSAVSGGITLPAACQPTVCVAGQPGGTVWNDFNADGRKDIGESTGVPDVTVKAYDCSGALVGTTTTDAFGKYVFSSIAPSAYPLRIEFTDLPSYVGQGTLAGSDGRTTVQFVDAADCTIDLGVLNPANYCQSSPMVYVSCFVNGDPLLAGTAAGSDAVVSFPYSASGVPGLPSGYTPPNHLANASEVGSIWGNAYNKFTKKIFMSATLRRHAGLGPMGLGGIYILDVTNPAAPTVSQFVNVTALGAVIDNPSDPVLSNVARGLDAGKTTPTHDPGTLSQIGRAGIGDLDISADGNTLWFVSLHDKKLYSVDITAYNADGVTKPTAANTRSFAIPDPGCTGGTYRPYGLAVKDGDVFVGAVCDAGVSQNKSDMRAYVYKWDGTAWTTVFDFPLTYPKGFPDANGSIINRTGWYPWTDDWATYTAALRTMGTDHYSFVYPMPILSDIEFDIDGAMILAFADRAGFIGGNRNYSPDINNTTQFYNNTAGGDILRAFYANGTYILENAAKAGPAVGYGPANNQGPGFGEFYNENLVYQYNGSSPLIDHAETVLGALAIRPGSGEVLVTAMDPLGFDTPANYSYNPFDIGGVIHANNTTGQKNSGYAVYQGRIDSGLFGKAAGLGDIELGCDVPEYIEIGNRVWVDSNKDGVQDPCEKALAGINVALYQGSTLIASTTTNAAGEYYFNNNPVSSTVAGTTSTTLIQPNTAYTLVFGVNGQFAGGILTKDNGKYQLTTANSSVTSASDLNDSDAVIATVAGITAPAVSLTTGTDGSVNHTIDAGFICLTTAVTSVSTVKATCSNITANSDAEILLTGIQNGDKVFLVAAGSSVPSYTATGSQPVSASAASFTGLANPASSTGQSYSVVVYNGPCCYTVLTTVLPQQVCVCSLSATVTPMVCNSLNNQYSISGTISLTNTPGGTAVITDGTYSETLAIGASATSVAYSLTGLESGTGSHTVVITLAGCSSALATYSAPASCTIAPSLVLTSATICYGSSATLTASSCIGTVTWSNGTTGNSLTTPVLTQTTNYTATCTTQTGSTTWAVGVATVMPQPVLSLAASSTNVTVGTPVSLSAIGCGGTVTWSTGENTATISVTPSQTTQTYSATCVTGPGCLTTATITVNTQPAASLVVVSATVCYSSAAVLTTTGCNNGTVTWSNGTTGNSLTTPVLTQTTNYTATCTTQTGSTTWAVGVATVMPQPVLSLAASATNVTVNTPVSLSAIGCGGTVTWSTGENTATISVTPSQTTQTYSATCLTGPGCLTTATITVNTQPAASLVVVSATVCSGSSATLTASGCANGTVTWSNSTTGNSLTTPVLTQTTAYTATCTPQTGPASSAVGVATVVLPASLTISRTSAASSTAITVSVRGCTNGSLTWSTGAADNGKTSIIVPAAVSSQYSVTCVTTLGCRSTAQVSVGSANTNDLIVADAMVCQGQSVTLTATGCTGSLSWLGNGINGQTTASVVVTPTQTQGYTAICTTGANSVEVAAQVTVVAVPGVTLTTGSLTVASGSVVSLTASGCTSGQLQWSIAGASGSVASATASQGTNVYSVSCVVTPTCSDVKSVTVTGISGAPILNLDKVVSASRAQVGDVISYTVMISNTGNAAGYSILVNDVLSSGLTILPASVSTNAGTYSVFSNQWSVGQLNGGTVATLTYSVSITADGVLYNTASMPGDTANVCTSVPIRVCKDSGYQIRLNAPAGYSLYQWYFKPVSGVETKVYEGALGSYTATQAGEYRLVVNAQAACPDQSCCPIIIEEQEVTSFTVVPTAPTCAASQANADGQLRVTGLGATPGMYQYAVSEGTSFTVATPTLTAVPPNGVVATGLSGNKSYTVRIYDALGCYRDQTVLLPDTCQCPPAVCIPISVKRIIR
ncbi:SdrD B-like domain-containing protein [Arsenicibacter rosenii]|uniref:SdrD B-like domain-containing protein n=1 Tax=Arsenicibacter rosenii TaxID=1750698 RepID=UPI001C434D65|nr:SdrD B-like domain-containing protein [Arsenicibacter rosenii]